MRDQWSGNASSDWLYRQSRYHLALTPLAAAGLALIMAGATVVNVVDGPVPVAVVTALLGLLAAFVAYGRWFQPAAGVKRVSRGNDG